MSTAIILMAEGSAYDQESYGIRYRSLFVYRVQGKGLHNSGYPHRIKVWDNTRRPNPRNGEPVRYGQYGRLDGGDGQYLDPNHIATDAELSYLTSSESVAITSNGTNTGTRASGQVYAPEPLTVGQFVVLLYPDGTTSDPMVLTARPLQDPELVPVKVEVPA